MLATTIALIAAHVLADFVLQPRPMVAHKKNRAVFAAHITIVGLTSVLLLMPASLVGWAVVIGVTAAHALIDAFKLFAVPESWLRADPLRPLSVFLADQGAHVVAIVVAAGFGANAFADGAWPMGLATEGVYWMLTGLATAAGFIVATRAGGFALAFFMTRFDAHATDDAITDDGVPEGGAWIGWLERALIFVLILSQQAEAIGLLIAAKSVLRFQYATIRRQSEIVIIGTLASFGWAIAAGQFTRLAIAGL